MKAKKKIKGTTTKPPKMLPPDPRLLDPEDLDPPKDEPDDPPMA